MRSENLSQAVCKADSAHKHLSATGYLSFSLESTMSETA